MKILLYTMRSFLNGSSRMHGYHYKSVFERFGASVRLDNPFPRGFGWVERLSFDLLDSSLSLVRFGGRVFYYLYWTLVFPIVRTFQLVHLAGSDIVIIQKALSRRFEHAFFEKLSIYYIRKSNKKLVYHFDDILMGDKMTTISNYLMTNADLVVTVNPRLLEYARGKNEKSILIPENIKGDEIAGVETIKTQLDSPITIGWIGIGGGYKFEAIEAIRPALERVTTEFDVRLKIVSNEKLILPGISPLVVKNIRWTQFEDDTFLCDIGINPLPRDMTMEGKGSYKLLKYMAHGIPSVTSWTADDFNRDGQTCLNAESEEEWYTCLVKLIMDNRLRMDIIREGLREAGKYSNDVLGEKYFRVLEQLLRTD